MISESSVLSSMLGLCRTAEHVFRKLCLRLRLCSENEMHIFHMPLGTNFVGIDIAMGSICVACSSLQP